MKKNILKKFIVLFSLAFLLFSFNNIYADNGVNINLRIKVGSNDLYNSGISVSPCDSDNDISTEEIITPYCAILQTGLSTSWDWTWAPGAFINSIKGIEGYTTQDEAGNNVYHYWSWDLNGGYASDSLNQYELIEGDSILLDFIEPSSQDIARASKPKGIFVKDQFYIDRAINFLSLNKKEDGSFGNSIYTDWVAIGVAKTKEKNSENIITDLTKYMKDQKFEAKSITDYERHAMALMSLGINPYDGTDINYISKIINSFDGEQIGEKDLINDDIFALLVLQNVGYNKEDEIIKKIISNILDNQSTNGSWGSVDMTGASIMALYNFKEVSSVRDSIIKAYKFIKSKEETSGNFGGNSFSTSWAMQAFSLESWYEDEVIRSLEFLARLQHTEDGFIRQDQKENQIWATAYSIPAVLQMSWVKIMDSFPRQEVEIIKKPTVFKKVITENENLKEDSNNVISGEEILDDEAQKDSIVNLNNFFRNKVIILTLVLVFVVSVGGWFVLGR